MQGLSFDSLYYVLPFTETIATLNDAGDMLESMAKDDDEQPHGERGEWWEQLGAIKARADAAR